jgi:hypothetical protein
MGKIYWAKWASLCGIAHTPAGCLQDTALAPFSQNLNEGVIPASAGRSPDNRVRPGFCLSGNSAPATTFLQCTNARARILSL